MSHPEVFKPQPALLPVTALRRRPDRGMVRIEGGSFAMGSDRHYPEEAPVRRARVEGFWIDRTPVTNEDFAAFVDDTGYVTAAEHPRDPRDHPGVRSDMLAPASAVFRKPDAAVDMGNHVNGWATVPGADWCHPEGPHSSVDGRMHHPVVHIGFADAAAYAQWSGKALPTEAQWEFAARGGLRGADYAWGDSFRPEGRWMANVWCGAFPHEDRKEKGFGTTPVGQFPPNGYGLYDMIGNVWEWTIDWYGGHGAAGSCGEARERSADPSAVVKIPRRVMKGGSYLCAANHCRRYRPAARMAQPIDTATCHLGFRCVMRESDHGG